MKKTLGVLILVAIFGGIFVFMGIQSGWLVALGVYGLLALLIVLIGLAVHLILN